MRLLVALVGTGIPVAVALFLYRWFLLKTDISVGYNWSRQGTNFYPNFDIRNHSRSRTYVLGNIAYTLNDGRVSLWCDNASIWGRELRPGTITHLSAAPVPHVTALLQCTHIGVRVRLQNGGEVTAQGPGQLYKGVRKFTSELRRRMERASVPLPG